MESDTNSQAQGDPSRETATAPNTGNERRDAVNKTSVEIDANNSAQTYIASVINQFVGSSETAVGFSAAHVTRISADVEQELLTLVVLPKTSEAKLLSHLEAHRVLLLAGPGATGKSTAAKYLATRLAEKCGLAAETQLVNPLPQSVRILMRELAGDATLVADRVTIFLDVFARKNSDLAGFFEADRATWDELATTLRARNAYWIFTSDVTRLQSIRGKLSQRLACHELPPASAQEIEATIDRKLAWLDANQRHRGARLEILRENRERITQTVKALPSVVAFIEQFVDGDAPFDTALERFRKPTSAFVNDLASDVDAWCFATALALMESVSDDAVPWIDFDRVRRAITERIKADNEMFPRPRGRTDSGDLPPTAGACLTDDELLDRCRAVVTKDLTGLRDVIAFDSETRAEEVWSTLLVHNRRALMAIISPLRALAGERDASLSIRMRAAQMIGHIGAIDFAIARTLIEDEWIDRRDLFMHPLVGRLIEGALTSGNERYGQACLAALAELHSNDADAEGDSDARKRIGAAIAAYSQLGGHEAARAMDHLGDIAIEHCAPSIAKSYDLFLLAERADRDRSTTSSKRRAEQLRTRRRQYNQEAWRRLNQQAPLLIALEQALVYLCLRNDTVQTLSGMRNWISRGGLSTATLVTMLFVKEDGIVDRLEGFAFDLETDHGRASISPIIASAALSADAIGALCAFLADVHSCIQTTFALPAELQRDFRERLDACLTMWARGAAPAPSYCDTVADLFIALAAARGGAMRRDLYTLIGSTAFAESPAMAALATAIRKRMSG